MFQFPRFASPTYGFSRRYPLPGGLPHSEIPGSKPARSSPGLIATCYVLHRLSVPRHPPNALITLDLNDTVMHREQTRASRQTRLKPPDPSAHAVRKDTVTLADQAANMPARSAVRIKNLSSRCQRPKHKAQAALLSRPPAPISLHPVSYLVCLSVCPTARSPPPPKEGSGGAERDRTDDLLLAKQALSQLSYSPQARPQAHVQLQRTTRPKPSHGPNHGNGGPG